MKFRRILIIVLSLFLLLDAALILDEQFDLFNGSLITGLEFFKASTKEKITGSAGGVSEYLPKHLNQAASQQKVLPEEPEQLNILRKCYSDVLFETVYVKEKNDWLVNITAPVVPGKPARKRASFYWAEGRLLPEEELENRDKYWPLIYKYQKMKDPALMTAEEIERIKVFSSAENRKNGGGTPMFFFDFLYAAKSQVIIEDHIVRTTFLGHNTKVHERILGPLKKVESDIYKEAEKDSEIKTFIQSLKSTDAYNWRVIEGTGRKSFHTYGIAVDVLPTRLNGKAIFWSWTKDKDPENWMLTPVNKRWNPPQKVIDIFESEGFIWGGNWVIFDNMHFEYHPELIAFKN